MQLEDGRLILTPSDLVAYLYCRHLSELSLDVARGDVPRPTTEDPELAVLHKRGVQHEQTYLAELRAGGRAVETISLTMPMDVRVDMTESALSAGADVIYQAALSSVDSHGFTWIGLADFLTRVPVPSDLGDFSYEPEDTKLARHVRPGAVLQLCTYAEQLSRLQGVAPDNIHVVLGGQRRETLRLAEFAAYFRMAKRLFEDEVTRGIVSYPDPVQHCSVCIWRSRCDEQRAADDHLSLVPGLTSDQARKFATETGIATVTGLASYGGPPIAGMGRDTFATLKRQAELLVEARTSATPPFELIPDAEPGTGLGALPEPDPGDLFFDIEGDPLVGDSGLEYLFGVGWTSSEGQFEYRALWGHDESGEKQAFEGFIDFVNERMARFPNLHIYHYASYEPAALGKLMGRYATKEQEVDDLLRGKVLVDLYRVVRQGVRVGTPSYSLKKLEALYMPARTGAITDGGSSIVEYERWLEEGDDSILHELEAYNKIDCESTRSLRDWLEDLRPLYTATFGSDPPRPLPAGKQAVEELKNDMAITGRLKSELTDLAQRSTDEEASAALLLGELLEWYRREDKPGWWRYYSRILDFDEDDFFRDSEAITRLQPFGEPVLVNRSCHHRYRFDPTQPHKLSVGKQIADPATERIKDANKQRRQLGLPEEEVPAGPGSIVFIDPIEGVLDLKRKKGSLAPHPASIMPGTPIGTVNQRNALRRIATSAIEHGIDGAGPYRAVRDLLMRRPPRLEPALGDGPLVRFDEDAVSATIRLADRLAGGCLAIQGPPGSGKTRTAARVIVDLVKSGHSVGIAANSHSVITNLLTATMQWADDQNVKIRASQKADDDKGVSRPDVELRDKYQKVVADLANGANVIAGTAWLFSVEELDNKLDYLVVDEAGQLSLANVCAMGAAARNLILVGDPRQLSQPSEGTHPPGAELSSLEHLLAGEATIPPDLGIFLDHTHRLHPDICAFISEIVYDGRLQSSPGCERQRVDHGGLLEGSGLRWAPVVHRGNQYSAQEEAEAIKRVVEDLVGRNWTNREGQARPLRLSDVLVVAPYNAQVSLIGSCIPGLRVGTVDRFQGQEAPVVIVSLTTSNSHAMPRGMDFLYSRERLNVAISRAQALAVVIGSPDLLTVVARTVEQLRLANGLCRFVELAEPVSIAE